MLNTNQKSRSDSIDQFTHNKCIRTEENQRDCIIGDESNNKFHNDADSTAEITGAYSFLIDYNTCKDLGDYNKKQNLDRHSVLKKNLVTNEVQQSDEHCTETFNISKSQNWGSVDSFLGDFTDKNKNYNAIASIYMNSRHQNKTNYSKDFSLLSLSDKPISQGTLWLQRKRRRCIDSSSVSYINNLTTDTVNSTELHTPSNIFRHGKLLQQIFHNDGIGIEIASFLKPSEIRHSIYALNIEAPNTSRYYELLCRLQLSGPELGALVTDYMGIFGSHEAANCNVKYNKKNEDDDVEFLGATFDPHQILLFEASRRYNVNTDQHCAPFELIYKAEILGKYCDECANKLDENSTLFGGIHKEPNLQPANPEEMSCLVKIENEGLGINDQQSGLLPASQSALDRQHMLANTYAGLFVALCAACEKQFVKVEDACTDLNEMQNNNELLCRCKFLPSCFLKFIPYDHAGILLRTDAWSKSKYCFTVARNNFLNLVRGQFSRRIARRFGHSFYQLFIQRILPPADFLEHDAKTRKLQYIRVKPGRSSTSRFKNAPAIDRYPLGSLQRSTALLIQQLFSIWASTNNVKELIEAEIMMIEKFELVSFSVCFTTAHNVSKHKDYQRAASIVEDFVLTRKINRLKFDLLFLPALWRVLHRANTRKPRTFTACFYDRQRVDKFFSACCEGSLPVLQIRGYIGFPPEDE